MYQSHNVLGRITRNLELKKTTNGNVVCDFSLAVDGFGKEAETDFIDCQVWGKTAEYLVKYATKGSLIFVVGAVKKNSWTDKTTNKTVYKSYTLVNTVKIASATKQAEHETTEEEAETQDPFASQTKVEDDPFVSSTNQFKDTSDMPF